MRNIFCCLRSPQITWKLLISTTQSIQTIQSTDPIHPNNPKYRPDPSKQSKVPVLRLSVSSQPLSCSHVWGTMKQVTNNVLACRSIPMMCYSVRSAANVQTCGVQAECQEVGGGTS